jgi:CBS domain-containing protein
MRSRRYGMSDGTTVRVVGDLVTSPPVVVGTETSLRWAARQLEMGGARAAVVGHTRRVAGLISDHDLSEAIARGDDVDATPVHVAMTPYFASVEATTTIEEAKQAASEGQFHYVAVSAHGEVVGLLSSEEILRVPHSDR